MNIRRFTHTRFRFSAPLAAQEVVASDNGELALWEDVAPLLAERDALKARVEELEVACSTPDRAERLAELIDRNAAARIFEICEERQSQIVALTASAEVSEKRVVDLEAKLVSAVELMEVYRQSSEHKDYRNPVSDDVTPCSCSSCESARRLVAALSPATVTSGDAERPPCRWCGGSGCRIVLRKCGRVKEECYQCNGGGEGDGTA